MSRLLVQVRSSAPSTAERKILEILVINSLKQRLIRNLCIVFTSEEFQGVDKIKLGTINLNNINLQEPKNKNFGDISPNAAMVLAPLMKQNPMAVAKMLVDSIFSKWAEIENINVANPGFINFELTKEFIKNRLTKISLKNEDYGFNSSGHGIKIQVEFVSANPTGKLHIGHGRWAALGDTLSNIYAANGFDVQREYYVNDFGAQIRSFASCIGCLYLRYFEKETPYPEEGYPEDLVKMVAEEIFKTNGDKFLVNSNGEIDVDLEAIGKEGVKIMLSHIRSTLASIGVEFDEWFFESTLYDNSNFENVIKELKDKKVVYEKENALWFRSSDFGDDKDRVIIRSGGEPTYFASDILYSINKIKRGFDRLIYILGADHHGYIKRLHAIGNAVGYGEEKINVIIGQLVKLVKKGQSVKMSKRKGKVYSLDDLVAEVGKDVVRYFFSMNSFDTPMDFDLDLAKQKSNQNPVYYVQYAHARISSVIENVVVRSDAGNIDNDFGLLDTGKFNSVELELAKTLIFYPDIIYDSCLNNAPHLLTKYLYRLASQFHYFYNHYRIIDENHLDSNRFLLILLVRIVLRNGLKILNVSSPEKM